MKLLISPSPHLHNNDSIEKNMYGVLIALIPAFICSVLFFGMGAVIVTLTSVVACLIFEYLIQKFLLKCQPSVFDGSAIITGVLLAFNVPSNLPVWIVIIGALVAIGIGKMSFGGLGCNIFNPALVGRVFLLISFPVQMTTWPKPLGLASSYVDAETGATPLAILKEALKSGQSVTEVMSSGNIAGYREMFLGNMGGSLGEVAAIALLVGFVYMLFRKIITWHIPVTIFATVFVFSGILYLCNPEHFCKPGIPFTKRRYDARSHLYGDGLRNLAYGCKRNGYLRNRYRYNYRYRPRFRSISGRDVICHPDHERFHSADQQIL